MISCKKKGHPPKREKTEKLLQIMKEEEEEKRQWQLGNTEEVEVTDRI